jgi:hypothetical protein
VVSDVGGGGRGVVDVDVIIILGVRGEVRR